VPAHLPVTARRSALAPLDAGDRVAAIEARLADAIALGTFADGEQLPSETELAARLGVARVTLREALGALRRRGLLETRRGRGGGSFVRAPADGARARLIERVRGQSVDELRDAGDHHAAIAGAAAELAALRASPPDLERLRAHVDALRGATSCAGRRAADVRFHVALAAAARSLRLTAAEEEAQAERGALVWLAAGEGRPGGALDDHEAILAAVRERDGERARRAASAHVARETAALIALRLAAGAASEPAGAGSAGAVLDAVGAAVDAAFAEVEALRDLVAGAHAAGRGLRRADLAPLRAEVRRRVARRSTPIAGAGVAFAGGVLEDAPHWLEWWCATPEGLPVFLEVSLQPADPDFYDYEAAEWFTRPRVGGGRCVTGPFVDFSGTEEHIFTLTVPVTDGDAFLGVAGADLAVGVVEAIAAPPLRALADDAALVNDRGRVIAANGPGWLTGTLIAPADAVVAARDPRLPWAVVRRATAQPSGG
jgi:GntR family transcriptional regulator, transcriptional repressor for pyruvate dehydrogenase complex